jgi:hypothetical protein
MALDIQFEEANPGTLDIQYERSPPKGHLQQFGENTSDSGGWEDVPSDSFLSGFEKKAPSAIKGLVGLPEGLILGGIGAVEDTARKAYSHIAGILSGQTIEQSVERGQQNQATIHPQTKMGKFVADQIGEGLQWIGDTLMPNVARRTARYSQQAGHTQDQAEAYHNKEEALVRSIWEGIFNFELNRAMITSPLARVDNVLKAKKLANEKLTQYEKEQAITKGQWEDVVKGEEAKVAERKSQDMGTMARDFGQFEESRTQSPYNISEEVKRQIEEEHNPTNAPETRVQGQGELFTDWKALTPDELQARRFVIEHGSHSRAVASVQP